MNDSISNPYTSLEERAFWAPSVGRRDALDIDELWRPKWPVTRKHAIATFGSCFAQHFGRALHKRGYHWFDGEPTPVSNLDPDVAQLFNYGVFSARTGNIYTVSLLRQWVSWAMGEASPEDEIWEKGGRFYDPFRPNVEPNGFASHEEMLASRRLTIEGFGRALKESNVFVFTMGLTESWWNAETGYEYPMCPGTVAGDFDPEVHVFKNQPYGYIKKVLNEVTAMIKEINPKIKILLTVSPVPLTATMSGNHVLVATTLSKSVLRAVAGSIVENRGYIDYFPSYEIISSAPFEGRFFSSNKRGVEQAGVDHVMRNFFKCMAREFPDKVPQDVLDELSGAAPATPSAQTYKTTSDAAEALVCEEELLAAFGPKDGGN